ncbi:head decoration protein [Streptomyces bacillaris]|uniref:head decoration protein n=1 Tax=Streptomyces bacillaris TaxID=68179 RepID=UPI003D74A8FF
MTLQPISSSRSYTADRAWLGSLHGTDQTEIITLDISKFTRDTHWVASTDRHQPYSRVLSGVPVGKIGASGLYGPYDEAAVDGRQKRAGVTNAEALFAPTAARVPVPLLWHGVVKASAVPGGIDPLHGDPVLHGRPDPVRVRG